jgi:hypothetical protein
MGENEIEQKSYEIGKYTWNTAKNFPTIQSKEFIFKD